MLSTFYSKLTYLFGLFRPNQLRPGYFLNEPESLLDLLDFPSSKARPKIVPMILTPTLTPYLAQKYSEQENSFVLNPYTSYQL